jgi:phage tail protein X
MNRYQNIPQIKIDKKRIYQTSYYPEVPLNENDIYVYTVQGDRFDSLAYDYYNDESLWWVISIANSSLPQNSLLIPEGIQIRIPANYVDVVQNFKKVNS